MPGVFDPPAPSAGSPSTPPPITVQTAAERLYRRLAPLAKPDPDNDYALLAVATALAEPSQIIEDVARDTATHEAWTMVMDPDAAPDWALPWLAQLGGTILEPGDTVAQQRERISNAAGFYRGTARAIREATQRTLTGDRTVQVLERTSGNRWAMTVLVRTSETPDPDAAERDARSQKPAGVDLTFVVSDVPIIDEGGAARTIDAIGSAGTTIDAITVADWT